MHSHTTVHCFILLSLGLLLIACNTPNSIRAAGETLGVVEPVPKPPIVLSLLVDPSPGSVNREEVEACVLVVLSWFVRQSPGSEVRVYGLREDMPHSARPVFVLGLQSPVMSGERSRRAMEQRVLADAKPKLAAAISQIFSQVPHRSPIAQALVVAATASVP